MKIILSLLQLILTSFVLLGQEYKIDIGSEIKLESSKQMEDLIHVDMDDYYIYYSEFRRFNNSPEFTLDKYNNKFEKTFSKKLITIENDTRDHGIKYMDGKFLWLTSVYEKSEKKLDFYITPIDLMGKSGKPHFVSSLILKKNTHRPEVNWEFSPDSSKIILFTETFLFGKNFDFLEYICVFDLDFKILNETYLDFDQKMMKAEMVDFIVSNDGTVFFANRSYGLNRHTNSL